MGKVPNSSPLLGFGIGLLVALLDWGNVPVPDWILYGAIAMAILLILAGVPSWARWLYSLVRKFRIRAPIYRLPLPSAPAIMIGNSDLERRIIRSLWRNSYFIRKAKDSPENLFHVGAYHPGEGGSLGPVVNIVQTVDAPVIVTLSTGFTLAEGPRDRFLAFADADKAGCRRMLAKALAALPNIQFSGVDDPLEQIEIFKHIALDETLNEVSFFQEVLGLAKAQTICGIVLDEWLKAPPALS